MFSCRTIFKQKTPAFSFCITNSEQNFFLCLLNAASKFILTVGPFGAVHLPDCNLRPVTKFILLEIGDCQSSLHTIYLSVGTFEHWYIMYMACIGILSHFDYGLIVNLVVCNDL